ncbi:MAG: GyrI-like domain-containing protein [Rhodoblastus sp.]|nr:MAG: GyrI-like domain-containing protein [Rhodoblastus sp.]
MPRRPRPPPLRPRRPLRGRPRHAAGLRLRSRQSRDARRSRLAGSSARPSPGGARPASPGAPSPAAPGAVAPQAATPSAEGETPLVTLAPRPAAILRGTSNWGQGYPAILTAFARLAKALDANGLKPAGKPLAVLIETRDDGFTFEAMAPLDAAPAGKSELEPDIRIGATPAGKAYKFQHRSAYDDLDSTYEAITAFLDEKAMQAKDVIIEEYLTTPKDADDTTLEVDVYVFLKE